MLAVALPDGRLRLVWNDRLALLRKENLVSKNDPPPISKLPVSHESGGIPAGRWRQEGGTYIGESRTGWQVCDLGVGADNVEIEAFVTLLSGVAGGLAFRPNGQQDWATSDSVIALDAADQCVFATSLPLFFAPYGQGRRSHPVEHGKRYHVRVCIRQPRYEVFIDDILVVQTALTGAQIGSPTVGLFVDRGCVQVSELTVHRLE